MSLLVGMDEAGYGPNLGPLIVAATAWPIAGDPAAFDPWAEFNDVAGPPSRSTDRLVVADSKAVYSPGRSLVPLETTVQSFLQLCDIPAKTFSGLWSALTVGCSPRTEPAPWFQQEDITLPLEADPETIALYTRRWQTSCQRAGLPTRPVVRATILSAAGFNEQLAVDDNKSTTLSRTSLALLASLVDPGASDPTLVIADKHGGRNRYDGFLSEAFGDRLVFRQQETAAISCYRLGSLEIHFQAKAEEHFPVAMASMVAKYIRELSMAAFNRYWCRQSPGLKPTRGYPVDARRFREDIAERLHQLTIPLDVFWRQR
ncbi:MAG: hypothetical protein QF363_10165 [Planctomycetaceae bacterium]|nr:hypothetical protein [Planctomycetaceae bacterium]